MSDTSRTVTLTVTQRFGLENLLGEQKGNRSASAAFYRVRRKIRFTPAEKTDLAARKVIVQAGAQLMIDEALAELEEPHPVFLESLEVTALRKLGESVEVPAAAFDWLEPLMEQLEAKMLAETRPTTPPGPVGIDRTA